MATKTKAEYTYCVSARGGKPGTDADAEIEFETAGSFLDWFELPVWLLGNADLELDKNTKEDILKRLALTGEANHSGNWIEVDFLRVKQR